MNAKQIIIAGTLLISVATFAQKEELKALKKIYAKDVIKGADLAEYKALVAKVQPLATEEGDKVYAGFYKAMTPVLEYLALDQTMPKAQIQATMAKFVSPTSISELAAGLNATLEYEKKTGKKIQTDEINETITSFKPELVNYADALGKADKTKEASNVLYSIYQLDKKDQEMLYYAANYAVNAKDFEAALKYYQELKSVNYSGEKTLFYAKNLASGQDEYFNTKNERDNLIKLKTHTSPRDEKVPSKRGEIYKNIALILVEKGRTDEAKIAIVEARKLNPDDSSLLTTEADLYFKLNDMESYKKLVNEALEKNPNDVDLIFNLGVVSANANKLDEAEKYYKRAIEINPNYVNAYLNLSELYLRADEKFVTDMNKLGNNEKDNKRYEVLKADRDKNFKKVMPLLKKVIELDSKNESAKTILLSVYNALDMQGTPEYKELKAKM